MIQNIQKLTEQYIQGKHSHNKTQHTVTIIITEHKHWRFDWLIRLLGFLVGLYTLFCVKFHCHRVYTETTENNTHSDEKIDEVMITMQNNLIFNFEQVSYYIDTVGNTQKSRNFTLWLTTFQGHTHTKYEEQGMRFIGGKKKYTSYKNFKAICSSTIIH